MADALMPDESWGEPSDAPQGAMPDESWGEPEETSSAAGAFGRGVAEGAIPSVGGLGAGIAAGAGIGAVASGPLAPVGAVVGGLAAGMGAGVLLSKGQDWVLDKLGLRDNGGVFDRGQAAADEAQHPYAKFAGEMAPSALLLRPGGSMIQRGVGAAIGAGATAATDYVQNGEIDPVKVAMGAGMGAAMPSTNRLGDKFAGGGHAPPPRPRAPGQPLEGAPPVSDPAAAAPASNEPVFSEPDAAPAAAGKFDDQIRGATEQRDTFEEDEPGWKLWNDHIEDLQSRADGKGSANADASLGPNSDDNAFTPSDSDRANDITTVAQGVAADNPPAPQIEGAGNPVGAPMEARTAQRPSGPLRDYRKETLASRGEVVTQESTAVSQAPIHEDVAAALKGEQPETAQAQAPKPAAPEPDAAPVKTGLVPEPEAPPEPQPAPSPRAPGKPVTEAVTPEEPLAPHEQRVLDAMEPAMRAKGIDPATITGDPRWQAMSPKEQAVSATKLLTALQSKTGEATGAGSPGEVRMPSKRPEVANGMTARSKGDAARKQSVLDAHDKAVAEFGKGPEGEQQGALLDRLKNMVQRADELAGGNKYRPNTKPPSWQLVQAARKALSKPTPANIKAYQTVEAGLASGGADAAKDFQDTNRINGDIENRPQMNDAATDALVQQGAPDDSARPEHEGINPEDNAIAAKQRNALVDWLNGISDESHAFLMSENPDLVARVKGTQNPFQLHSDLVGELGAYRKPQAQFEAVPAEDAPTAKRTPIKTRDDLAATEPGAAAGKARVLDKNSPEFKAAAAAALERMGNKPSYSLEHEEAAQRMGAEDPKEAVDGSWDALKGKWGKFVGDESGAVQMPAWLKPNQPATPKAPDHIQDAVEQFTKDFHVLAGKQENTDLKLRTNAATVPDKYTGKFADAVRAKLELDKPLTADEQSYYDTYVKPVKEWGDRLYDKARILDPTLPAPHTGLTARYVPRTLKPEAPTTNNEHWVQTLSDFAGPLEERGEFALDDGNGMRTLFRVSDGKNGQQGIMRLRPGSGPQFLKTPSAFSGELGDKLTFNVNGKPRTFTVDHATTAEIKAVIPDRDYINDPVIAYSNRVSSIQKSIERSELLTRLKSDQRILDNSTTDKDEARKLGYSLEPTILPEMAERGRKTLYLPQRLKWAFDDYAKPGLQEPGLDPIRRFAQAAASPLYILSPGFHVLNIADNWAHAMATEGVKFRQFPQIGRESLQAIKEAFTGEGPVSTEFREAGGRLLHGSTLLDGGLLNTMMQHAGIELAKKPSIFDPITKATGISIPDAWHTAMNRSNRFMWTGNDMFALSLYQRNRRLGMSPPDAVDATKKWIGDYSADAPTFAGSRILQQLINDPAVSWFGRYHQDQWRTYGTIVRGLLGHDATRQQQKDALGALVMSGLLMFGLYPHVLDKGAKLLSGNDEAEFGRRGLSSTQDAAYHLVKGDKTYSALAAQVFTPSIPLNLAQQGIANKNWTGKDIAPAEPLYEPKNAIKTAARLGDWAATQAIPGLSAAQGQFGAEGSVGGAAKKFALSTVGIKDPSEGATRFEAQREKTQAREDKRRDKHPGGALEYFANRATE